MFKLYGVRRYMRLHMNPSKKSSVKNSTKKKGQFYFSQKNVDLKIPKTEKKIRFDLLFKIYSNRESKVIKIVKLNYTVIIFYKIKYEIQPSYI